MTQFVSSSTTNLGKHFDERKAALMLLPPVDDVVMSVPNDGFAVIDAVQPDVIATGYDQQHLRDALTDWMATHRTIPSSTSMRTNQRCTSRHSWPDASRA